MDVNWQTCKLKPCEFSSYLIHGPKIRFSEDSSQEWQRPGSWGEIWGIFDNINKEQKYKKENDPAFKIKAVIDQVQDHSGVEMIESYWNSVVLIGINTFV